MDIDIMKSAVFVVFVGLFDFFKSIPLDTVTVIDIMNISNS